MRLRNAIGLAIAVALLCGACSRLTFVKPSAKRGASERIAPEYDFRDNARGRPALAARDQLVRAEQQLRSGNAVEAEATARAALKADATLAGAHAVIAMAAELQGRAADAGRHYGEAATLAPSSGAFLNNYGAWLCRNGRATESLAWFDRALADRSYDRPASALANAGACAAEIGQYGRVERDLRAAVAADPENEVALEAMAAEQFRQQNFMDARAFSERRLAAAPATPAALDMASRIERALGDTTAAARYVQRLRAEFPQAATAHPGTPAPP